MYSEISQEIIQMAKVDQKMRFSDQFDESIDRRNTTRMEEIVAEIGWPTISKMGKEVSLAAWLLVQHADLDIPFQQKCLTLMKDADKGDVHPSNIAYLTDRVLVNQSQKQVYGTQFYENEEGVFGPRPIEEAESVDERRAAFGMNTMAEYDKQMQSSESGTV